MYIVLIIIRYHSSDILITPLDQFASKVGNDPKWEDKTDERLVWVSKISFVAFAATS